MSEDFKMLARLADRLVLMPTTHPIESETSNRQTISLFGGELEYYADHVAPSKEGPATGKLLLIKFPGTGGRAERAGRHPAECWGGDTVTWTINPMGYGGSTGPATLQRYPEMVRRIGLHAREVEPDRKIVVTGNSLGGISALAFAASFPVAGMLLRNPAPIHQLISKRRRYVVPTLGLSKLVAATIPVEMDCLINASKTSCPCWFVTCEKDLLVPPSFQDQVWDNLLGVKSRFSIPNAGHGDPVPDSLKGKYHDWIRELGAAVVQST